MHYTFVFPERLIKHFVSRCSSSLAYDTIDSFWIRFIEGKQQLFLGLSSSYTYTFALHFQECILLDLRRPHPSLWMHQSNLCKWHAEEGQEGHGNWMIGLEWLQPWSGLHLGGLGCICDAIEMHGWPCLSSHAWLCSQQAFIAAKPRPRGFPCDTWSGERRGKGVN